MFLLIGGTIGGCWILYEAVRYVQCIRSARGHPGYRVLFSPPSLSGVIVPRIPWISLGKEAAWNGGYEGEKFGYDGYTTISAFPTRASLHVADSEASKVILSSRFRFRRPHEFFAVLSVYGDNLVAASEQNWSRHRKVAGPSFTERNIASVCQHTIDVLDELLGPPLKPLHFENIAKLTDQITLYVIARAGFGFNGHGDDVPAGHQLAFMDAMETVARDIFIRAALPPFLWGNAEDRKAVRASGLAGRGYLGSRIQKTSIAFAEIKKYITEMILERRTMRPDLLEQRADLFSNILKASDDDTSSKAITDEEATGNIFIFLAAGHETTAHTFAFALGLLALHPEVQEELHAHLRAVLQGRTPRYEDLPSLKLVQATFNEALRLYPVASEIQKVATEDTFVDVKTAYQPGAAETSVRVAIPAGSEAIINVVALHHNPRYWNNPEEFYPSRFLEPKWPRDAFLPFSAGARSCLGRRFAETEGMVVIATVVSRYMITVDSKKFAQIPGETPLQTRNRLLSLTQGLTLNPNRIPLVFTPRLNSKD